MKITLYIGNGPDNEIRYADRSVSGRHAQLILENGLVKIEDLNSANGTMLNGRIIHEALVTKEDIIKFGNVEVTGMELFEKLGTFASRQKTDFSEEYKDVLKLFNEYRRKSILIIDPPKWPLVLRICLTIGLITVLLLTDIIPRKYHIIVSVLIGMTALIPSIFSHSSIKRKERLDSLKIDYEDLLVCPKCKISMIHQSRVYWEGRKKCINDRCDARFEDRGQMKDEK